MPKLKTPKSVAKRIRITKTGKVMKKKCGQDHFNAREGSKTTRHKRKLGEINSLKIQRNIKKFLPHA